MVERGDAVLCTLSSHVRRARRFESAVHGLHLVWLRPLAQTRVLSHMQMQASLRVQTTSLRGCRPWRLRNASDLPVVVNVRVVHRVVGDPSNPTDWQTCFGLHYGGLKPCVRFADSRESPEDCGTCWCRFVPRVAHP